MVGDEAQLYRSLAARLEQIVRLQVRAPREVIEDACHHAWAQLINHGEDVNRDATLTWLTTTAVRHAWKLDRRERRERSLDAAAEQVGELPIPSHLPGPAERAELNEQIAQLVELPERQRRLIWLRAAGLSYVEMAAYTGDSIRTVERQIVRATERIRQLQPEDTGREPTLDRTVPDVASRRVDGRRRSLEDRGLER